jgi:hypothetical protein
LISSHIAGLPLLLIPNTDIERSALVVGQKATQVSVFDMTAMQLEAKPRLWERERSQQIQFSYCTARSHDSQHTFHATAAVVPCCLPVAIALPVKRK